MAAPLGFKTFTVGEVLSAADVNGYLMQGVLVFATAAARNAAITSPQEGQFAFTKDTNSLFYYDGAAWVASGATGDIEGVTAGTGISGGGTSGTVTVTNSMATAIDAKGDLIVGTGSDAFSRLAVGTNTYTLVADSAEATGLKWAAPASGSALTLITTASPSAASSVSINSCFSATYENYLIMYNYTATNGSGTQLRMRAAGTDDSSSTYYWNGFYQWQTAPSALTVEGGGATTTEWQLAYQDTQGINTGMVYLYNPFSSTNTLYDASTFSNRGSTQFVGRQNYGGRTNNTTSYDGFSIVMNTPTITGKVRVYGIGI